MRSRSVQSQRDCVFQPRVVPIHRDYPGSVRRPREQPQRGCDSCVLGRQEWIDAPDWLPRDPVFGDPAGIPLAAAMVRRNALDDVGGFDESFRYAEDRDLLVRLREHGVGIDVLAEVVLLRRYHGRNMTAPENRPDVHPLTRSLKGKLLLIGYKAEASIADATRALVERRPSLAQQVIDGDDQVDKLELEIDNICFEILAREQPVASDLRFITTAMKIVGDIERIGDNGVNIARRALEVFDEPELKPIIDIPVAAAAAQRILKESLDAFVNSDAELAKRVIQNDRYIDDVCEQMLRELLTYMFEDPSTVSRALRLMFVARNLERIGDHAANIAEMVIFLVEGQDVRHRQAAKAQAGG